MRSFFSGCSIIVNLQNKPKIKIKFHEIYEAKEEFNVIMSTTGAEYNVNVT